MNENELLIGFIEEFTPEDIVNPLMSRSGGQPSWLGPKVPPNNCPNCRYPLTFILQLDCPLEYEYSVHRVEYLFYCKKCNTFHCLRNQLPEGTEYDDEDFVESIVKDPCCHLCGFPSHKTTLKEGGESEPRCKSCGILYCNANHLLANNKEHTMIRKELGNKSYCQLYKEWKEMNGNKEATYEDFVNPENEFFRFIINNGGIREEAKERMNASQYIIGMYDENEVEDDEKEHIEQVMKKMKPDNDDIGIQNQKEIMEIDDYWLKFNLKMSKGQSQVLRYHFGGKPLWIHSKGIPQDIPCCPRCKKQCVFEWQLCPQFVYQTNLDIELNIDFGVVVVFACPDSCGGDDYVWENVYVQENVAE